MKKKTDQTEMSEEILIDFCEFDFIRLRARDWIAQCKKEKRQLGWYKTIKPAWVRSDFYIGRGVTRLNLHEITLTIYWVSVLLNLLRSEFKEYSFHQEANSIYIYFRGERKK